MPFAHEVASVMHLPMQQIEQLRRRNSIQIEGAIRLGVIESLQSSLLPGVIQHLLKKHPGLQLKPARGRAVELIAAVKANELDAAIVVQPVKGGSQRLRWQHLSKTKWWSLHRQPPRPQRYTNCSVITRGSALMRALAQVNWPHSGSVKICRKLKEAWIYPPSMQCCPWSMPG